MPSKLATTQQVQPMVDNAVRREPKPSAKYRPAGSKAAAPTKLTLSAWNPLHYFKLLWWLFITPHQLQAYRTNNGEIGRIRLQIMSSYLFSSLTWLPLLLPSVALCLDLLPHPADAWSATTYEWISLCLIGMVALGGWLNKYDNDVEVGMWFVALVVLAFGMVFGMWFDVWFGVAVCVAFGAAFGAAFWNFSHGVPFVLVSYLIFAVALGATFVVAFIAVVVVTAIVKAAVEDSDQKGMASWLSYGCFSALVLAYGFLIWYCYLGGYYWFA